MARTDWADEILCPHDRGWDGTYVVDDDDDIKKVIPGGALSRAGVLRRLRASLKHEGYSQVPQLEGPVASRKKKLLDLKGDMVPPISDIGKGMYPCSKDKRVLTQE